MKRQFSLFMFVTSLLLAPTSAQATAGFLQNEESQAFVKVCFYDVLGETHSLNIGATDLCPLTHEFDVTPKLQPPTENAQKTGFFKQEQTSGFSKLCSYDMLGEVYVLTIGSTEICPLTYKF
ncbi:hypothetical protein [Vibrio breoganii]|uniref:hypothetical protein n=1 Tax=Vibrio breoganii TaxID=553239 RepID=UPI000C82BB96|nr:hypothetical protein [Vibrio breoganii]PMG84767.1 hypothetical protein BCU81_13700 [Vibrio breoganii]PMG89994.1 hypothetical protein BCU79_18120 [Vibrio breoganii]PMJ47950.1 hypothetical protein BCU21_05525 [Vibrio breoganii]PMK54455.1 hypothetical protein BCT97_14785 [Vibrio breoganii]PML40993.1 hypothetical protein BCT78_18340 [Vibrio breoganii]